VKIIAPPTISNLKELADLLLNPAKYAKYLGELQKLLDAVNERLEDLDQFETISAYKAKADAAVIAAKRELNALKDANDTVLEQQQSLRKHAEDDAQQILAVAEARVASDRAVLEKQVSDLAAIQSMELDLREQGLQSRERDLEKRSSELAAAVSQHESKVAKLKAAVS